MSATASFILCEPREARKVAVSLVERRLAGWVDILPEAAGALGYKNDLEDPGDALLIAFSVLGLEDDLFEHLQTVLGRNAFTLTAIPAADAPAPVTQWILANVRPDDERDVTYVEAEF